MTKTNGDDKKKKKKMTESLSYRKKQFPLISACLLHDCDSHSEVSPSIDGITDSKIGKFNSIVSLFSSSSEKNLILFFANMFTLFSSR